MNKEELKNRLKIIEGELFYAFLVPLTMFPLFLIFGCIMGDCSLGYLVANAQLILMSCAGLVIGLAVLIFGGTEGDYEELREASK